MDHGSTHLLSKPFEANGPVVVAASDLVLPPKRPPVGGWDGVKSLCPGDPLKGEPAPKGDFVLLCEGVLPKRVGGFCPFFPGDTLEPEPTPAEVCVLLGEGVTPKPPVGC